MLTPSHPEEVYCPRPHPGPGPEPPQEGCGLAEKQVTPPHDQHIAMDNPVCSSELFWFFYCFRLFCIYTRGFCGWEIGGLITQTAPHFEWMVTCVMPPAARSRMPST